MNRRLLTAVFILACCFLVVGKSDACELPPIAVISNPYSQTVCVGCEVEFDGSTSYDQDEEGNSVEVYYWNYSVDSYCHEDGEEPNHVFNTAGYYGVYLYVEDDEEVMSETYDSCVVYVVGANSIVEQGTTDEGPLYVCPDDTVNLEVKPNPSFASFPSGEPHWTIESEPNGSNASLNPSSGSATTTLSGITKLGEYVIKAQCGDSDTGDTITVHTPSTSGLWEDWIPFSDCPPENWSFLDDDCDNWLSVYCDSNNHLSSQAFSWWYTKGQPPWVNRGTEVGCCVWIGGYNLAQYKHSFPGKFLYLKTEQISCNNHWGIFDPHGEGCYLYYCYRFVTFDCVTNGATPNINWYRDSDICYCSLGSWPDPCSADSCPGSPGGKHPGYPD